MKKILVIIISFISIEAQGQVISSYYSSVNIYEPETLAYIEEVADIRGTINNKTALNNEIRYAKDKSIWSKIAYWIDKDFGEHIATAPKIPLVVFDYDDGRTSNCDSTYPAFVEEGIKWRKTGRPSFNLSGARVGTTIFATWAKLYSVYTGGVEMTCHGYTHGQEGNYSICTDQQIIDDMVSING